MQVDDQLMQFINESWCSKAPNGGLGEPLCHSMTDSSNLRPSRQFCFLIGSETYLHWIAAKKEQFNNPYQILYHQELQYFTNLRKWNDNNLNSGKLLTNKK